MIIKIFVDDYRSADGEPLTLQYSVEDKDFYMPLITDFLKRGLMLSIVLEDE